MKYLILGDLHCREVWKDIITKEDINTCDKVIFLGDYVPPREVKLQDPTDACRFLYEVLDFKDKYPDKVVLLRGNHDMQALGYYWADCNPIVHPKVAAYCRTEDVKNWFLSNTQWIYQIPDTDIICSHAGLSKEFVFNVFRYLAGHVAGEEIPYLKTIGRINDIEPCELFGFTPCKFSDYSGESATQPCTWIRPRTLSYHAIPNITYVVGHTPVKHIEMLGSQKSIDEGYPKNGPHIWCCDCLERKEYLVIDNGEFVVKTLLDETQTS